ncbi:MAG: PilN domain-containing protein [Candidatus Omnitrophica bacterium]|nr:PilN domain-containing protein [Candidatus Omnitrophota bacterium]
MFGSDKRYLSISINEGVIKVAQVTSAGVLEKVARASFNPLLAADEVALTIKNLLGPFDRKAAVICTIPANAGTAKNIEVPSTDPEEIKSIINLQASRHTPYSKEEVLIRFINLGVNVSNNNTRLLLVIVHRNMLKERILALEKAGLNVDKILFVPEAMARFYAKSLNLRKDAPLCGVIDFSLNSTSYIIVSRGTLVFVRHIPVGIKNLMEGADGLSKLQEELKKSIDSFSQEDGAPPPGAYLVTTDHEAVRNILPALKTGMNLEFSLNAFVNFIKGPSPTRKKLQSDFGDDSFLDVISSAMSASRCEVNLMPEEMILKKTVESQSREATKSGVAAVFIMVLIGAMIMSNIYFKDVFLNKNLREHFAPQRTQVQELQDRMNKAKVVRGYIAKRMVTLDMIHELYRITPHTIYLNNIAMDEDGTVTIDGISDSMSQVFSYVKALDDSTMFKEAKTKTTATKKDNGKDVASFQIEFKLVNLKEPA